MSALKQLKHRPNKTYITYKLHILNRSICYLTIMTIKDLVVLEIHKDPGWTENINKLVSFYFQQFIPFLNNKNVSM